MRFFKYLSLCLVMAAFTACWDNGDSDVTLSGNAELLSLTFKKNDSIPYLETASFIVDNDSNVIYNPDSLPFQTRIDSVYPTFSFKSTSGAMLIQAGDTIYLSGSDTIDFSITPTTLVNYPASGNKDSVMRYAISVNVHQVEPNLYTWSRMNEKAYTHGSGNQRLLNFKEKLFLYVSSGVNSYLHTSSNGGKDWTDLALNGLGKKNDFRTMVQMGETLYLSNDSVLYSSTDGVNWNSTSKSADVHRYASLLFELNEKLHAVVVDKYGVYRFATMDGETSAWTLGANIPNDFPVEGFASLSYLTGTSKQKGLVIGGISARGAILNTRWSTENGSYWVDFTDAQPTFGEMTNAAIVSYDDKFLMFGGTDGDSEIIANSILESVDEGLNWYAPDTAYNKMPEEYKARTKQAVAVGSDHNIYIVGGENRVDRFADVWKGRLNKLGFDEVK